MNQLASELSVTLSPQLYDHFREEASRLGLPIEWLIASLIVDTVDEVETSPEPVAA